MSIPHIITQGLGNGTLLGSIPNIVTRGFTNVDTDEMLAVVTGTATNVNWTVIRDTGGTLIVTLTNDTYIAAGTGPIGTTAESDAFVQSFVALSSPAGGWNNQVSLDNTDLVRTSPTVATITVPATAGYDPQINELISGVVQAAILVTSSVDIDTSAFTINISGTDSTQSIDQDITTNIPQDINTS